MRMSKHQRQEKTRFVSQSLQETGKRIVLDGVLRDSQNSIGNSRQKERAGPGRTCRLKTCSLDATPM